MKKPSNMITDYITLIFTLFHYFESWRINGCHVSPPQCYKNASYYDPH